MISIAPSKDCIVIGGGLTGLTLTYLLQRSGLTTTLLERSDRLGGAIHTEQRQGFTFECGPTTGMIGHPEVADLLCDLGQQDRFVELASRQVGKRFILKNGCFRPLPSGLPSAIKTDLFSVKDKLRILLEPWRRRGSNPDESIASLVRRRLGESYYTYAVDPFVGGIYAGDPEQLVTRFALPKLYALEANYGSFIRGAIAKAIKGKTPREKLATRQAFSTIGGLSTLIDQLSKRISPESIRTTVRIDRCSLLPNGTWEVLYRNSEGEVHLEHSHWLVSTIDPQGYTEIFQFLSKELLDPLLSLRYAPVTQIAVGYNNLNLPHFCSFGGLIPSIEDDSLLGILHPSAIFEGRAPQGGSLLSLFWGGMRKPEAIDYSDEQLRTMTLERLQQYLGIQQAPDMLYIVRHPRAIPQYEASTQERLATIDKIQQQYPGLLLAGNIRDGIGMADRIKQAYDLSSLILQK